MRNAASRPRYQEHAPHPALRGHVRCYWTIRGRVPARAEAVEAVVPDACMDFLFDLADGSAHVVGTMTRPLPVLRGGWIDLLGVRFEPGGIGAVVSLSASELTDGIAPLGDVLGREAPRLLERLEAARPVRERLRVLDAALLPPGSAGAPRADDVVLAAVRLLEDAAGRRRPAPARGSLASRALREMDGDARPWRVDPVADALGVSRRQLERRFLRAVGVPPKTAARVMRFQRAIGLLLQPRGETLAAVALRCGYHDQAHFTREFSSLAGEPPGAYRSRRARTGGDAFLQDDRAPASHLVSGGEQDLFSRGASGRPERGARASAG